MINLNSDIIKRFWDKVNKTDSCWLWLGYVTKCGGLLRAHGSMRSARKISYQIVKGYLPEGYCRSTCQVRECVNPNHLLFELSWGSSGIKTGRPAKTLHERFWSYVEKTEGCWLWVGYKDKDGYGLLRFQNENKRAHRLSYKFAFGEDPKSGILVCHTCDTPSCVRPEHLFLGTPADNSKDMVKKGRSISRQGEESHQHKLTELQVKCIRALHSVDKTTYTNKKLGKIFGVLGSNISQIVSRKTWKHI